MSVSLLYSDETSIRRLIPLLTIPVAMKDEEINQPGVIIQWGNFAADSLKSHRLNPKEAVQLAKNKGLMKHLLTISGVKTSNGRMKTERESFVRKYVVPVFHLESLTVFRTKQQDIWLQEPAAAQRKYVEVSPSNSSREIRKVRQMAVRAIYTLGLDFGLVLVGIKPGGVRVVIDVEPAPSLNQRMAHLFAQAIHRFAKYWNQEKNRSTPTILGMDPEFVLRNSEGKLVSASRFLTKKGPVGCDAIWLDRNRTLFPLAELRPEPSSDPRQLILNLYSTMSIANKKIQSSLDWLAGGMPIKGFPLGGHIHMSSIWLNSFLLRALDNYLALPLMLIEDHHTVRRRPKYGFLGDFRTQFHGGFEYRTLPSWLVSPRVTKGVIALAKIIADNYMKLDSRPFQNPDIQEAYYVGDKLRLYTSAMNAWIELKRLPDYEKYAGYLDPLYEQISEMKSWNELKDIRPAWKIPPFHRSSSLSFR